MAQAARPLTRFCNPTPGSEAKTNPRANRFDQSIRAAHCGCRVRVRDMTQAGPIVRGLTLSVQPAETVWPAPALWM